MKITRNATKSDIEKILTLQQQYWSFEQIDHYNDRRNYQLLDTFINNHSLGCIFVAEDSDLSLFGYIIVCLQFSFEYGGIVGCIDELYVNEDKRSSGAGSLLLNRLEQHLRSINCVSINLEVDQDNDRAKRFYYNNGFLVHEKYATLIKML